MPCWWSRPSRCSCSWPVSSRPGTAAPVQVGVPQGQEVGGAGGPSGEEGRAGCLLFGTQMACRLLSRLIPWASPSDALIPARHTYAASSVVLPVNCSLTYSSGLCPFRSPCVPPSSSSGSLLHHLQGAPAPGSLPGLLPHPGWVSVPPLFSSARRGHATCCDHCPTDSQPFQGKGWVTTAHLDMVPAT